MKPDLVERLRRLNPWADLNAGADAWPEIIREAADALGAQAAEIEDLCGTANRNLESMLREHARAEAAEREAAALKEEVGRLNRVLVEARENMAAWGSYASAYFQEKHDLTGDLDRITAALQPQEPKP